MGRQNESKAPWGHAYAIIADGERDLWLDIGAAWENKDGSISLSLRVEPLAWRNPNVERRIVVQPRREGGSK